MFWYLWHWRSSNDWRQIWPCFWKKTSLHKDTEANSTVFQLQMYNIVFTGLYGSLVHPEGRIRESDWGWDGSQMIFLANCLALEECSWSFFWGVGLFTADELLGWAYSECPVWLLLLRSIFNYTVSRVFSCRLHQDLSHVTSCLSADSSPSPWLSQMRAVSSLLIVYGGAVHSIPTVEERWGREWGT